MGGTRCICHELCAERAKHCNIFGMRSGQLLRFSEESPTLRSRQLVASTILEEGVALSRSSSKQHSWRLDQESLKLSERLSGNLVAYFAHVHVHLSLIVFSHVDFCNKVISLDS